MIWLTLVAVTTIAQAAPAALTRDDMAVFLQQASVVRTRYTAKGITSPLRLTMTDGRLTHDAAFQRVDERQMVHEFGDGRREYGFVDSWRYNLAAFELAELLGIGDMMPVTVERVINGTTGALSWWVDTMMDEGERMKKKMEAPDAEAWNRQMHRLRVFTELVQDTDRNLGNVLITREWQLRMIDFTRAFRTMDTIREAQITRCDRKLLAALEGLTVASVTAATERHLLPNEVKAVLARRDRIVKHVARLVAEKGEAAALY